MTNSSMKKGVALFVIFLIAIIAIFKIDCYRNDELEDEQLTVLAIDETPGVYVDILSDFEEQMINGEMSNYGDHFIRRQIFMADGEWINYVIIQYPHIMARENDDVELIENINGIISEIARNHFLKQIDLQNERMLERFSFQQSYRIEYLTENIISISFHGDYGGRDGIAVIGFFKYATTIDLQTGEILTLPDFTLNSSIENMILAGEYRLVDSVLTEHDIGLFLNQIERHLLEENHSKFYLTDNNEICVIIDLVQAQGWNSTICVPF